VTTITPIPTTITTTGIAAFSPTHLSIYSSRSVFHWWHRSSSRSKSNSLSCIEPYFDPRLDTLLGAARVSRLQVLFFPSCSFWSIPKSPACSLREIRTLVPRTVPETRDPPQTCAIFFALMSASTFADPSFPPSDSQRYLAVYRPYGFLPAYCSMVFAFPPPSRFLSLYSRFARF
jgi:hypothetical protein